MSSLHWIKIGGNPLKLLKAIDGSEYLVEEAVLAEARAILHQLLPEFQRLPAEKHWRQDEEKNLLIGWIGEKIFDLVLNQHGIQHVWNHPLIQSERIKKRKKSLPDFYVGELSIDVKTTILKENSRVFYVNKKRLEKHKTSVLVFISVAEDLRRAFIHGWLPQTDLASFREVEGPHASAYMILISRLRPMSSLISLIGGRKDD